MILQQEHQSFIRALRRLIRANNYNKTKVLAIVGQLIRGEAPPVGEDQQTIESGFRKLGAVVLQLLVGGQCHTLYITIENAPAITSQSVWDVVHVFKSCICSRILVR